MLATNGKPPTDVRVCWPILLVLLSTSACYVTRSVRPEELRLLGARLDDARPLTTPGEGSAMIDAEAGVRLHLVDGLSTDWVSAGNLRVAKDTVFFGSEITSADLGGATVGNLEPEQLAWLEELAPSGGAITPEKSPSGANYQLKVSDPKTLLPWIVGFVLGQRARNASEGRWILKRRRSFWSQGDPRPFFVSFDTVTGPLTGDEPLFIAHGVPWSKLESIDINYLHPVYSALSLPLSPLLLLLGPPDDGRESAGNPFDAAPTPRQVWRRDEAAVQPLFSWQGKRRAIVKLIGGLDGGVEYGGSFYSSASLGLRFRNMYEISFVARELSKAGGVGEPRQAHTLMGISMGLHIDGDGDPRFAFYVGVEVLGYLGGAGEYMNSLVFGPRFGLRNGLYLMVVPLSTTSLCRTGEHGSCVGGPSGIYSSIQLGYTY